MTAASRSRPLVTAALAILVGVCALSAAAQAQVANPVYVDDSPAAAEALARAEQLAESGNLDEAARVLQQTLREHGAQLVADQEDEELYASVRRRAHQALLARPDLLSRYRASQESLAARTLAEGDAPRVERLWMLTDAGFEATLRIAQDQLEHGRFHAALRTISQLERHPARLGEAAEDAASLAALIARYVNTEEGWALVERWRREAGLRDDPDGGREAVEGPPTLRGVTPFDEGEAIDLTDLVSKPFWSVALTVEPADSDPGRGQSRRRNTNPDSPEAARLLHVFPTVAGDLIYVNDSQSVSAWDRFTLALRWRVAFDELPEGVRARFTPSRPRGGLEDVNTVTVSGPWAIAATGLAASGQRYGDARLHAMDARTGDLRWSRSLAEFDPTLKEAVVYGPILEHHGLAIAAVSTRDRQRRLASTGLLGINLGDGTLAWRRPLGSAGQLAYPTGGGASEAPMIDRGLVFHVSRLGLAGAVNAVTGRTVWVRTFPTQSSGTAATEAWEIVTPQLIDGRLFMIAPDSSRIIALNAATGEVLGERRARTMGLLKYLLKADDTLLIVSSRGVFGIEGDRVTDPDTHPWSIFEIAEPRGRMIVAGDRVLAPGVHGVWAAPIARDTSEKPELIPLDRPGAILAMESELVVVDDEEVHTYLIWGVAERMLLERMDENPSNAAPAATFAELAHRAGRTERIIPAIDRALDAIEADPISRGNAEARRRLFEAIMLMVDPDPEEPVGPALARDVIGGLLDRADRLASGPEDQVLTLLARGAYEDAEDRPLAAVESYQRVLDVPRLARESVERHGVTLDAETEATRRLWALRRRHGAPIYARYDAEAAAELARAQGSIDPEAYARIARQYPIGPAAAQAWLDAAQTYASRGRTHATIHALDRGLRTAEEACRIGDPIVGELAGRLVRALANGGRVAAATMTLERLEQARPDVTMTINGNPIELDSMRMMLVEALASQHRRPRIGRVPEQPNVQALEGWVIETPTLPSPGPATSEFAFLVSRTRGEIGVFAAGATGGLVRSWVADFEEDSQLLFVSDRAVFITRNSASGLRVVRYDLSTGRVGWESEGFDDAVATTPAIARRLGRGPDRGPASLRTPNGDRRPITDIIAATDGVTLALVQRTGRTQAIDLETGRTVWTAPETLGVVYDVAATTGALVIGGIRGGDLNRAGGAPLLESVATILDLESGGKLHDFVSPAEQIRWTRLTSEGVAIIGFEEGIGALDLYQGKMLWLTDAPETRATSDAWVFPGRVLALNNRSGLHHIETESGKMLPDPIPVERRISPNVGPVWSQQVGDLAALATSVGVALIDRNGEVAGLDRRPGDSPLAAVDFAEDLAVAIDAMPENRMGAREASYTIHLLSTGSLAAIQRRSVTLWGQPLALKVIDDRILVTSGDVTVVIDAPARDR